MREPARRFDGLHVLADDDPRWPIGPVAQAEAACRGGAAVVQLRCKHGTDAETLALAHEIRALTRAARVAFVMNDRFDLALACGADAVHLGQDDLPPSRLPPGVRAQLAVGRSTHDLAQAEDAVRDGVDYVAFGPLFGTASKQSPHGARSADALAAVVARVAPLPVVAIGGIDADNAAVARSAGARGIAVISAVAAASDPAAATRALVRALSPPAGERG